LSRSRGFFLEKLQDGGVYFTFQDARSVLEGGKRMAHLTAMGKNTRQRMMPARRVKVPPPDVERIMT